MTRSVRLVLLALSIGVAFTPPAVALDSRSSSDYTRKLAKLEQKRVKEYRKLEKDYLKFVQKPGALDPAKLEKRRSKFHKKMQKIEQEYYKELRKLESKQSRCR